MISRVALSKDFHLDEFTRSQVAERHGITIEVARGSDILANLQRLCLTVLQPLRDHIGVPIHVDSGYRPPRVNALVGGAPDSQHCEGQAADIVSSDDYGDPLVLAQAIAQLRLPYDQLIYEFGRWVHVSVAPVGHQPRGDVLTSMMSRGKVRYVHGLVEQ